MQQRPRHVWRRRLIRAALCLVLGAATTVGVAWEFSRLRARPLLLYESWFVFGGGQDWVVTAERGKGWSGVDLAYSGVPRQSRIAVRTDESIGVKTPELRQAAAATVALLPVMRFDESPLGRALGLDSMPSLRASRGIVGRSSSSAYGWPCLSVGIVTESESLDETTGGGHATIGAVTWGKRRLPLLPIWPGFVLDTLFYAVPWGVVFFAPGAIRRRRRRRRGRCVHCGYDLAGLSSDDGPPTCPECGA